MTLPLKCMQLKDALARALCFIYDANIGTAVVDKALLCRNFDNSIYLVMKAGILPAAASKEVKRLSCLTSLKGSAVAHNSQTQSAFGHW